MQLLSVRYGLAPERNHVSEGLARPLLGVRQLGHEAILFLRDRVGRPHCCMRARVGFSTLRGGQVPEKTGLPSGPVISVAQRFLMSATAAAGIGMKIISSTVLPPLVQAHLPWIGAGNCRRHRRY